ncbi:MBL fold metallo-hydrolase [Brachybacterium sp. EF45031]|uniref:MBL fold metallo-hydrolase n=1 Tax=Brachybacterium sillae TaxID=2810536 RepID=UPI00217DFF3E|nr:MBL fold metallo-hydrolase [Brachybacterium sillae]MCS6711757.1 MBL fold metallo-hydrolase [Brachybacterium sillae]
MLLERIFDEDLAQAGYVIGCQAKSEMMVIDARRDIQEYLDLAAKHGMTITHVTETHIHADYLSGTRELAAATGATIHVSVEGGQDWQYGFEAERLHDGDEIRLGNITVRAVHTPGHTPEHLMFLVTDGAFADEPGYAITGDFVFSGDLGRPDLLDEAAGGVNTRFVGAEQLFESLKRSFLTLPDHVQVLPGHGAGSACGKALGSLPGTTVGYERRYAWWAKHLENDDKQGFIDELLDGQPDAHAYFARMKRQNKLGPEVMGEAGPSAQRAGEKPASELHEFTAPELTEQVEKGEVTVVDTRMPAEVHTGTVPGALNIPVATGKIANYGAWVVDPEREYAPLVVLADDEAAARDIWSHLVRVGIDKVTGFIPNFEGMALKNPETVPVDGLDDYDRAVLLDVRQVSEHKAGAIPGARQLSGGKVLWNLEELPRDGRIVLHCQSGMRASVVASALRHEGFDVTELEGSYNAWVGAGRETVTPSADLGKGDSMTDSPLSDPATEN